MENILTDKHGKPFSPPQKPPMGASIEVKIAYIRAKHEYNDRVADCANKAFAKSFRP